MIFLLLPLISLLLLAAHFLRAGQSVLMLLALLGCLFLIVPRAWAAHLIRLALIVGAMVWLHVLVSMATIRWTMDQPFLRLSVILSCVLVITIGSVFVFAHPRVKRFYGLSSQPTPSKTAEE
jgi:hypothetical protein